MDSDRSWLQKLQPRDKDRERGAKAAAPASPNGGGGSARMAAPAAVEEALSSDTKQKVAAAKQYIEDHQSPMKLLQERKERKFQNSGQMSLNPSFVLRDDTPVEYFCISCKYLVYPDSAVRAPCCHLICGTCRPHLKTCPCPVGGNKPLTIVNCEPINGDPCCKKIEKVFVHCSNCTDGCMWIGTLSEYRVHRAFCQWGLHGVDKKYQQAKHVFTTKEMAEMYPYAYFVWSWQDELIDGQSVVSDVKIQCKGMCAFFSTASVFEANLRLKGHRVKLLSWMQLYHDFMKERARLNSLNAPKESKLVTIARILENKGMIELSAEGVPLQPEKRHKILKFKKFNMRTTGGVLEAVNHVHDHGPIICVHGVTRYQDRNTSSAGVIHTGEDRMSFCSGFGDGKTVKMQTHAVCTTGIGSEDLTSFFAFQNSMGVSFQKDGFGRLLASNVLESIGLFCDENIERPSKRAKASRGFNHGLEDFMPHEAA